MTLSPRLKPRYVSKGIVPRRKRTRGHLVAILIGLEKRLSTSNGIDNLLFTLKEIENIVYKEKSETRPEYILLTTDFQKRNYKRIQRLLQISQNKTIKTMIVEKNSSMGSRLSQFGGLICMVYQQNK